MNKFLLTSRAFIADENGVAAIEYALLAALIGVAATTAMTSLGRSIRYLFNWIAWSLWDGGPGPGLPPVK